MQFINSTKVISSFIVLVFFYLDLISQWMKNKYKIVLSIQLSIKAIGFTTKYEGRNAENLLISRELTESAL